jgi:hypothetical protein
LRPRVIRPALHADHCLSRRRQENFRRNRGSRLDFQALETGSSEKRRIDLAGLDLLQARFDVAAQRNDLKIRTQPKQLGRAAPGGSSHHRALLELIDGLRAD